MTQMTPTKQASTPAAAEQIRNGATYTPRVDILEGQDELLLFADLPGVSSEDLDVRFEKGELLIYGRCKERHGGTNYLFEEYGVGDFYRAFTIGEAVDANRISAELKNGVLTVHLPKSEAIKPKRIAVKSA